MGARPARTRGDEGLSLIELLVALLVLGVVMTGLVAMTISTLRVTVINDARTVATNLAQAELERVRALPFADLEVGRDVKPAESAGYVVVRDTSWVELDTDTDVCSEPPGSVATAMLRIDVTVGFGDVDAEDELENAVSMSTTVARPPVADQPDVGALSVLVLDHQTPAVGTGSALVKVVGPAPSGEVRMQTTPASGCVLFAALPPGDYQVQLLRTGFVADGARDDRAEPTIAAAVTEMTRSSIEVLYAPAASVTSTWVPRDGGPVVLPQEQPVTISRAGLVLRGPAGETVTPLFPNPWQVWAGDCPPADPEAIDAADAAYWSGATRQAPVELQPGVAGAAEAKVARVRWTLATVSGSVAAPRPVTITATALPVGADPAGDACLGGTGTLVFPTLSIATGELDNAGNALIALPYGSWQLSAVNDLGDTRTGTVTVDPTTTGVVNAGGGPG